MDNQTAETLLQKIRTQKAAADLPDLSTGVSALQSQQASQDAMSDVGRMGLAALGVGVGARGALGLVNLLRRSLNPPHKLRAGPAELPLPYPVEPDLAPENIKEVRKRASDKAAIPWYGPAMLMTGLGGLAAGWKGTDALLESRRKADRERELQQARQEFHDALLSQYDKPLSTKVADADDLNRDLEIVFENLCRVKEAGVKEAIEWDKLPGMAGNAYGTYAALTGLVTGMLAYDQANKRSRRAVLDKAMKMRQQARFNQTPTAIYAVPEPVTTLPKPDFREEMASLAPVKEAADPVATRPSLASPPQQSRSVALNVQGASPSAHAGILAAQGALNGVAAMRHSPPATPPSSPLGVAGASFAAGLAGSPPLLRPGMLAGAGAAGASVENPNWHVGDPANRPSPNPYAVLGTSLAGGLTGNPLGNLGSLAGAGAAAESVQNPNWHGNSPPSALPRAGRSAGSGGIAGKEAADPGVASHLGGPAGSFHPSPPRLPPQLGPMMQGAQGAARGLSNLLRGRPAPLPPDVPGAGPPPGRFEANLNRERLRMANAHSASYANVAGAMAGSNPWTNLGNAFGEYGELGGEFHSRLAD